ncbi:maleylpyruvate isomerase family mycothiol-dependent enzyme [Streptomyces sp. MNU76]|uniref:maleylpyruvate isomerase family mycothiol-dependent enzyme n=1 Tax=Streptomyces sp. MNU76 TaxID=2560026 RepID=UPI001E2EDD23|nr:maleylpyruvate isomerase family mycothiol-dependent enzyme [Streptomyces sp. MNU76]MCC9706365.1 maleylpyruvate isomerase family mycothiol-dependent enzyme [Streptomyces sp. MNU76]
MMDHARDLASVCEATDRLLSAVADLENAAVTEPSRLPGWTRGHVLAHLARNADALVNVFEGRPMYISGETRDADIERDAPRPLQTHLADVRDSAHRFQDTASLSQDWSRTVELRNGVLDTADRLPWRRWIEVELHHVDLGIGYGLEDLPGEFAQREINFLANRFRDHPGVPALMIRQDDGRLIPTGDVRSTTPERLENGEHLMITGTRADLLGWLAGRRDGTALGVEGGTLPSLPPL